jgi:hypothetical protein
MTRIHKDKSVKRPGRCSGDRREESAGHHRPWSRQNSVLPRIEASAVKR